jgi:hypothetical protein
MIGPTEEVFRAYVASHRAGTGNGIIDLSDLSVGRSRTDFPYDLSFESMGFRAKDGSFSETQLEGEPFDIVLTLRANRPVRDLSLTIVTRIYTAEGQLLFPTALGPVDVDLEPGVYETGFRIDPNPLGVAPYNVEIYMFTGSERQGDQGQDLLRNAGTFYVEGNPFPQEERYVRTERQGLISLDLPWEPLAPARTAEPA